MMVFMCNLKKINSELSVQELLQETLWKSKITGKCRNPWTLEKDFLSPILFHMQMHFNRCKKIAYQRN